MQAMNNDDLIKGALMAIAIAFTCFFIVEAVSTLALSPPWDFYLLTVLVVVATTFIYWLVLNHRR